MKKIYILEHFNFTNDQLNKLNSLGEVHYFEYANEEQINEAILNADVIMLDWIDPTNIITKMKSGTFVNLPFTGYGWISTINQAINNGVTFSNTPNYSTNAVAEHHLALILSVAKHINLCNDGLKQKQIPEIKNIELCNKTIGIIGLGHIGYRLYELLKPFNAKFITYNRTQKNIDGILDTDLNTLLKESDIVCVTCALNDNTKNLISENELKVMKDNAIITTTTNGVINLKDLERCLDNGKFLGIGLEEFMELEDVPYNLINNKKVVSTYHKAYDTNEAEFNRLEISIKNIEAFLNGSPINVIK